MKLQIEERKNNDTAKRNVELALKAYKQSGKLKKEFEKLSNHERAKAQKRKLKKLASKYREQLDRIPAKR